jgi:two-component system OmpR family sensor kinase
MRLGYRARLTGWHAIVLAIVLGALVVVLDWTVRRMVLDQFDAVLLHAAQSVGAEIADEGPAGPVPALSTKPVRRLLWSFRPIIQIFDRDGAVIIVLGARTPLPIQSFLPKVVSRGKITFQTLTTGEYKALRVVALRASHGSDVYGVQVAHPLDGVHALLDRIRLVFAGAALVILVAIVTTDLVLTRQVLRPIDAIVRQARRLSDARLAELLPHPNEPGEVARLVETLNAMLGRVRDSLEAQQRFTADAAHELRSPLTRLRTEIEVSMRRPRDIEEYRSVLAATLEEIERLSELTESLLTLARLDAGEGRQPGLGTTRLAAIVDALVSRFEPMAVARDVTLRAAPYTADAVVAVFPAILEVAVGNIVDNALKFSGAGGTVELNVSVTATEAFIAVSDSGPGIPADELPHVFERFFRGKGPRAAGASGVGLGLAIARVLVERQNGAIEIDSKPGVGTIVTIRLPLAAPTGGEPPPR